MNRDEFGRNVVTEEEFMTLLYSDPDTTFVKLKLLDPTKYNNAVKVNYSELPLAKALDVITVSPEEWHKQQSSTWFMPQEYTEFDISKWVLDQCNNNETELQRCAEELFIYSERNLLPMLCYLKYFVDTLRKNNIVWGVGRGSSVASFVLYKIGIHRINSITFELNFNEFMK